MELGVDQEKNTETLDYCHAVEHLSAMVKALPRKGKTKTRATQRTQATFMARRNWSDHLQNKGTRKTALTRSKNPTGLLF